MTALTSRAAGARRQAGRGRRNMGKNLSLLGILTCGTTSTSLAEREAFFKKPSRVGDLKRFNASVRKGRGALVHEGAQLDQKASSVIF